MPGAGQGTGGAGGARGRELKTKAIDKKAVKKQQDQVAKQPNTKVAEIKARKAAKKVADTVRAAGSNSVAAVEAQVKKARAPGYKPVSNAQLDRKNKERNEGYDQEY